MIHILYDYRQYLSTKCYAETTKEIYLINVKLYLNFIKEYKGKNDIITICNVSKYDIYNYIASMDNLSKNTKNVRLNAIKNFYFFLNRNISDFLFQDVKLFDSNKKLPRQLGFKQIQSILEYYQDKRNSLIIFLFLSTGIRISELTNILIQNINFDKKYINLKVKGGYYRHVYINENIKNRILDYIGDLTEGNLFDIKRREVHNIVKKAMTELNIKGSAHTFRHTFATEMYKKTRDILLVKELLGHKRIESTQIYACVDNDIVRQAVESNPLANYKVGGRNEN